MPIVRARGTSVKERVAAIEKSEQQDGGVMKTSNSDNSVIRAKYSSDVRGVNRYRHFHTPNLMNDVNKNNNNGKEMVSSTQLPFLIRPGQIHYIDPDDRDAENGMEKGVRKKKKNVTLPQLNTTTPTNNTLSIAKAGLKPKKENDLISRIEERAKSAIEPKSSSESDNSLKSSFSGVRLNDNLTQKSSGTTRRTFASLGQRQNGVIITRPVNNSLDVALPPRSKSAQDIEARSEPKYIVDNSSSNILSSPESRDMATQTAKNVSTASVEFLNCVRSTQTDSVPYVIVPKRKNEAPVNLHDIEEREALMEVIEDALGETFDRYSRVRTNQIIANSARKQAQIWRDAKDFLANSLFPQAIQTANKSTSRSKTAAEIVANIKMYP